MSTSPSMARGNKTKSRCREEATFFSHDIFLGNDNLVCISNEQRCHSKYVLFVPSFSFHFCVFRANIDFSIDVRTMTRPQPSPTTSTIIANDNNCKRHYDIMSYVINEIHMSAARILHFRLGAGIVRHWHTCEWREPVDEIPITYTLFIIIIVISFIHLFFHFYSTASNDNENRHTAYCLCSDPILYNFFHPLSLSLSLPNSVRASATANKWTNSMNNFFIRSFAHGKCIMSQPEGGGGESRHWACGVSTNG